jgi:hypothetical protein
MYTSYNLLDIIIAFVEDQRFPLFLFLLIEKGTKKIKDGANAPLPVRARAQQPVNKGFFHSLRWASVTLVKLHY